MSIGKAVAICDNLDSERYSPEEKALAIQEVMNMPTHMSVKKDTLVGMIKWLWNFNLEVSESHSGKRIVEIPTPHGRLIDADRLIKALEKQWNVDDDQDFANKTVWREIESAPTVIEAEE